MATIGSLGVGSGLDLNGLMEKLTAAESAPVTALRKTQTEENARLSAYGTLQSLLATFNTAAGKLSDTASFGAHKATSSATDVLSAAADTTAVAGNYAVNVTQLAQAQSLVSGGQAGTTTAIGSGATSTVTIEFGAVTGTLNTTSGTYEAGASFLPDASRTAVSFTVDGTNNTLAGIRDTINKTVGLGVTASIVNDGTADRLLLTSAATGQRSSMRIAVTGDAAVQSLLANDPAGTQNLRQTVAASNAALTVNGLAVTSASNTVGSALQGVTMTLTKTGSTTLAVAKDTGYVQTAVTDFVNAYNSFVRKVADLSKYDVSKKTGGALVGDSVARLVMTRLRSILTTEIAGSAGDPRTLTEIGVAFQTDGTLAVNTTKLDAALAASSGGVSNLLAGTTAAPGVAKQLATAIDGFNATDGLFKAATDGASTGLRRLASDIDDMQERIDAKLARYRAQFQELDRIMSGMTSTSNYLTQQFAKK